MTTQIHLTAAQVSGYLDRALSREERAEIEQHLDQCEACRMEVAEVDMLAQPQTISRDSRRRLTWLIGAALAASLAGLALVRLGSVREPQDGVERPSLTPGETLPRLRVVTPAEGDTINADDRRLAWRPLPASTYHVALLADDGEPLWTVDTGDTTVTIPDSVRMQDGRTYFWRVDAVRDGVAATSGVIPFSIGPP